MEKLTRMTKQEKKAREIVTHFCSFFSFFILDPFVAKNQRLNESVRLNSEGVKPVVFRNCAERWATLL
jgi:hypothetical protein